MRRTAEIIICDICGAKAEITRETETHRIMCPARLCYTDGSWTKSTLLADMCSDCYNAYFALFDQHFATIRKTSCGEITATKKFKTEDPFTITEEF